MLISIIFFIQIHHCKSWSIINEDNIESNSNVLSESDLKINKGSLNSFTFHTTESRNVIFVGRTRTGKSMTIKTILDPEALTEEPNIFRGTENPEVTKTVVQSENFWYDLSFIDTPGLFELSLERDRSNSEITGLILKCMKNEITRINVIFITFSIDQGLNVEDFKSIKHFKKLFSGSKIILLVTRSEMKNEASKEFVIDQIHKMSTKFPELSSLPIMFMGSLNHFIINNGDQKVVDNMRFNIHNMRKLLLDEIFNTNEDSSLTNLLLNPDVMVHWIDQEIHILKEFNKINKDQIQIRSVETTIFEMERFLSSIKKNILYKNEL
jgi:GTP-binding protein EngB required for normal cell division